MYSPVQTTTLLGGGGKGEKLRQIVLIGYFRIVFEQKNKDEAEATNLHFLLFEQRKM